MSVYNEPLDFLRIAVDSILRQTYKDFEFIIVLDKPDNVIARDYLQQVVENDKRVLLFVNTENIGLTKSLNVGLALCRGQYIARMDADDESLPRRLEEQVRFMDTHPEIVACGTQYDKIDERGALICHWRVLESPKDIYDNILFDSPICHPSAMIRRVIGGNVVRYDETLKYAQDYGLWASFISSYMLANLPNVLFKYRISENQVTKKNRAEQQRCRQKIQLCLLESLGLNHCGLDLYYLDVLLVSREKVETFIEIENFITSFISQNRNIPGFNTKVYVNRFLINYANYLPKHYTMIKSLSRIILLSIKLRSLSVHPIGSVIKKYI